MFRYIHSRRSPYTIALDTIPTSVVEITATTDAQTQISIDGINFASTQVLSLTDMTPQTITVRAVNDPALLLRMHDKRDLEREPLSLLEPK